MENLEIFASMNELSISLQKINDTVTQQINKGGNIALIEEECRNYRQQRMEYVELSYHLKQITPQLQDKLDLITDKHTRFEELIAAHTQETNPSPVITLRDISRNHISTSPSIVIHRD